MGKFGFRRWFIKRILLFNKQFHSEQCEFNLWQFINKMIPYIQTSCMPIIFFIRWKNNENCFLQERNSITKEEKKNTTEIDNLIYIMLLFTFHLIWKHWVFRYAFHGIIALSWNLCRIFIFIIPHTHTHTQTCFNAYKELFHLNFLPKHLLQL